MGILRTDNSGLETPTAVTGSVEFDGTGKAVSFPAGNDFAYGTVTLPLRVGSTQLRTVSGVGIITYIFRTNSFRDKLFVIWYDDNGKLLFL